MPSLAMTIAVLWLLDHQLPSARRRCACRARCLGTSSQDDLTWAKPHFGCGYWLRNQTEHCILAVRGSPTVTLTNQSTALVRADAGTIRKSPTAFYALVESLCPAPRYLELFARKPRPGWEVWGDECHCPPIPSSAMSPMRMLRLANARAGFARGFGWYPPRRVCGANGGPGCCGRQVTVAQWAHGPRDRLR